MANLRGGTGRLSRVHTSLAFRAMIYKNKSDNGICDESDALNARFDMKANPYVGICDESDALNDEPHVAAEGRLCSAI
jgi:hypothetical protein